MNIGQPKGESTEDNIETNSKELYTKLNFLNFELGGHEFTITGRSCKISSVELRFKVSFNEATFEKYFKDKLVYSALGLIKERLFTTGGTNFHDGSYGSMGKQAPSTYTSTVGTTIVNKTTNGGDIIYKPTLLFISGNADKPTGGSGSSIYAPAVFNSGYRLKIPTLKTGLYVPEVEEGNPINNPELTDIIDIKTSIYCTILGDPVITVQDTFNSQSIVYGDILNDDDKAHFQQLDYYVETRRAGLPKIVNGEYTDGILTHLTPHFVTNEKTYQGMLDDLVSTGTLGYSLSHNNHSGEENGIKYYSTRPSSKVSEESNNKMKTSQRILRFLNKLIGKKGNNDE